MDKLILHAATETDLQRLLANPSSAVLLVGPLGAGKGHVAQVLAAALLGDANSLARGLLVVKPEKDSIGIDAIREIKRHLSLRMPGENVVRRVIIIEDASIMTIEAQNALLKALEEPPADTVFILTVQSERQLLGTIQSRTVSVILRPLTSTAAVQYFKDQGHPEAEIVRAYLLSAGGVGLMTALLEDKEHPLKEAIKDGKTILGEKPFERLSRVDELSRDKERLELLLEALRRILRAAALAAASKNASSAKTAIKRQRLVQEAQENRRSNPNTKLLLTDLLLNL